MIDSICVCKSKINELNHSYKKYVTFIMSFQKHIEKLYGDKIVDTQQRIMYLKELEAIIKLLNDEYNTIRTSYSIEFGDVECESDSEDYNCSDVINFIDVIDFIDGKNIDIIFNKVREAIVEIGYLAGFPDLESAIKLITGVDDITYIIDEHDKKIFDIYNKFMTVTSYSKVEKNNSPIKIENIPSKYEFIIHNFFSLNLFIKKLPFNCRFEGSIENDVLNVITKTSKKANNIIYEKKESIARIINNDFSIIDHKFIARYFKCIRSCYYLAYNSEQLIDKIARDYNEYKIIKNKSLNSILHDVSKQQTIEGIYNAIFLMLLDNDKENNRIACLVFDAIKENDDKSMIIYNNLSFKLQRILEKGVEIVKAESNRMEKLSIKEIDIVKQLATMVNMPDNVKAFIMKKQKERNNNQEGTDRVQNAIDALMSYPWPPSNDKNDNDELKKSISKSQKYLNSIGKKLDETIHGHDNSKKMLVELIAKWIQNPKESGYVIGLAGPPGVGKTLFAKGIGSALDIPTVVVQLGGMNDAGDLIGHNSTYVGANYGMIVRQMIKSGNHRCVMLFDELDKTGYRHGANEIFNTLIHITDPNMNKTFQDRFFSTNIEFDLSNVLMIFSYNDPSQIDPILIDRIHQINVESYSVDEKIIIVKNHMLKEISSTYNMSHENISLSDDCIKYIIEKYTHEAGVRDLKRKLEKIIMKLNIDRIYIQGPFRDMVNEYRSIKSEKNNEVVKKIYHNPEIDENDNNDEIINKIYNMNYRKVVIDHDSIHRYLEQPKIQIDKIHFKNISGMINGLYATASGHGGIICIQITKNYMKEDDYLQLTGNQSKVMIESVKCAFDTGVHLLNAKHKQSLSEKFANGFHIHVPDGATPKDGPSAGCAFTTAIISAIIEKPINREIAMTGEIEMFGKISKIGGLIYKLRGAKAAGVKTVYICKENKDDYESIKKKNPELFSQDFTVKIVSHIIDIVTDPNVIIGVSRDDFDEGVINLLT